MAIDLTLSSETGLPLTDNQLDANFVKLQNNANSTLTLIDDLQADITSINNDLDDVRDSILAIVPLDPNSGQFYSQLILRLQKGSALTNEELDSNFVYLDTRVNRLLTDITTINDVTIPDLQTDYNAKIALKQNAHPKLSSISAITTDGIMAVSSDIVTPRAIVGSTYIQVQNGNGVAGNPTIAISNEVATTNTAQTLSNKSIDGNSNTIANVSLVTAVKDVLGLTQGGTGGTSAATSRTNLNVLVKPTGTGIVVKTDNDASTTRNILASGIGLSIVNDNGTGGDIVVASNATPNNTNSTVVARNNNGDFAARQITADLFIGNLNGNATSVTHGVYTNYTYSNPSWLTSLAGSKVTSIPNSSLVNSQITINGTPVSLGGAYTFDPGTASNVPNSIVKRDGSGNFSAGTITATLNGTATAALTANSAGQANKLTTPRLINGVAFDGTANISIADSSKLPIAGGTMTGYITLHAEPAAAMHPVPKQYVDRNDMDPTYGTVILSSVPALGNTSVDIFPPPGKTMANLRGFLPAMGQSNIVQPVYSTNLILVIDISNSMYRGINWNNISFDTAYLAAGRAAQALINHYASLGPVNVCLVRTYNSYKRNYKWFGSYLDAYAQLNTVVDWTGPAGSIIDAHDNRPVGAVAQTVVHFLTDANRNFGFYDAFGNSVSTWRNYLNNNKIRGHSICIDSAGSPSYIGDFAWDGLVRSDMSAFRALLDYDLPKTYFPGIYNNASIGYQIMGDRIRISLTDGLDVNTATVNWLALWGG